MFLMRHVLYYKCMKMDDPLAQDECFSSVLLEIIRLRRPLSRYAHTHTICLIGKCRHDTVAGIKPVRQNHLLYHIVVDISLCKRMHTYGHKLSQVVQVKVAHYTNTSAVIGRHDWRRQQFAVADGREM